MERRRHAAALLVVSLVAVGAGVTAGHTGVGNRLELPTLDARYALRGSRAPWPGVVVVGIDSPSITALGDAQNRRRYYAAMLDRLRLDGARVIAYDLVFDGKDAPANDRRIYDAVGRARGHVVLAAVATNDVGETFVLGGVTRQRQVGAVVGSANFPQDADGVVRRVPYAVERLQSFAVAVATLAGRPALATRGVFRAGSPLIDYPGPAGTVPTYSFVDVLEQRVPARALRGRIVVVGATAADLHDVVTVPVSRSQPMSGPELEADAIATVMQGAPLRSPASGVDELALVLCALAPALLAGGRRVRWLIAGSTVALVLLLAGAQAAFDDGSVIALAPAVAALLTSATGSLGAVIASERREVSALRKRFARVDEEVVDAVLADPGGFRARALAIGPESVIAGYRLEATAGRGGMGVVYRATQLRLDRPVAVKLIHPDRADDPEFRARFERESRLAAGLEHPHVIPVYEAGDDNGLLFIAMRHVSGRSLHDMLGKRAPLPPLLACALVAQIARALHCAHTAGLIHRDVKPANVLVDDGDDGAVPHCYLTDFGVSVELRAGEPAAAERWVGTLDYMAPEQRDGQPVGPATDIYALGRILHESLCGRLPTPGGARPSALWPAVPPALDAIVARALATNPADRYATALEFARALDPVPQPAPRAARKIPDPSAVTQPPG